MKQYKVTYTKIPTNHNHEKCLVVKAEDEVEAIITAVDHLTQKGYCVGRYGLKLSTEQQKKLTERGLKWDDGGNGSTVISGVEEWKLQPRGKVVEG